MCKKVQCGMGGWMGGWMDLWMDWKEVKAGLRIAWSNKKDL